MADAIADVVERGVHDRIFSGAAWSVGDAGGPIARGFAGARCRGGSPVGEDALWDLASVTKPIVALTVMALVERGALSLTDSLGALLPGYGTSPDKAGLTVSQLLTHTSGLPGATPLWRTHHTREDLLAAIRDTPLPAPPGTRVEYSSQGFILLGLVAEAVGAKPLDALVRELVTDPAGMRATTFTPDPDRAVSTEECAWRGRLVTGQVHDENAVVLGEPAGHAGLFAPLADLERLARTLLTGRLLRPETHALMTAARTDGLNLRRGLGWQGRDEVGSPVGTGPGPRSYGHTGFTGTSLWIDPDAGRAMVLLTNRVHPTRTATGIERVRREFHELAMQRHR
ncbi:serine hydrolase domain-containing protein [Pseudonocardia kunmingensis]|uniref:CubicO group peptidase (Beta-lactamase class C family) n=1 Tax=Pseudonocardia kunmingensis TaxID=630975 RepID=A0A543DL64_9PSEU|nr:serine hydrolase domain-containing protein [Pseudonocardia kunmingensis]TQM10077.1 CubicO group peptidase (beta-lactamase class C family) [Pseudonocardia kunmingensis]